MHGLKASKIVIFGLISALMGGALFLISHLNQDTAAIVTITGYALIIAGGILFLVGTAMLTLALKDPEGVHQYDTAISYIALVRCMVAMSVADGDLDQQETTTISRIYKKLTGEHLNQSFIKEIADTMKNEGSDIQNELIRVREILTDDLKNKIIKASFFILAADGLMDEKEESLLEEIRKGLDYPALRFIALKKKFIESRGKHRS